MKIVIESTDYIGGLLQRDEEISREASQIANKPIEAWTAEESVRLGKLNEEARNIAFQIVGALRGRMERAARDEADRRIARLSRKKRTAVQAHALPAVLTDSRSGGPAMSRGI